jgi:hypothetical protein
MQEAFRKARIELRKEGEFSTESRKSLIVRTAKRVLVDYDQKIISSKSINRKKLLIFLEEQLEYAYGISRDAMNYTRSVLEALNEGRFD